MAARHYIDVMRLDHWPKNVFAVPGFVLALVADPHAEGRGWETMVGGAVLVGIGLCFTASSNYVINEWLDAPYDRAHPDKFDRPAARGDVSAIGCIALWLVLGALGIGVGAFAGTLAAACLSALWLMGLVYNVRPIRTKEVPYLDVVSESVNNPIRLWAGWAATGTSLVPPISLLLSYWALGAFFMAVKRYAELRHIGDPLAAAAYRASFRHYTEERLLISILAYVAGAAMFGGIFLARYRLEFFLAVPVIALFFASYLRLGLLPDSPAATPERLIRQGPFVFGAAFTFALCLVLILVDIPILYVWLSPSVPEPLP